MLGNSSPKFSRRLGPILSCLGLIGLSLSLNACQKQPKKEKKQEVEVVEVKAKAVSKPHAEVLLDAAKLALPDERIKLRRNPDNKPFYEGATGTASGIVKISGLQAPTADSVIARIPKEGCEGAFEKYSKVFREGEGRTLADVLVTVTHYKGVLPRKERQAVKILPKSCAYEQLTMAINLGDYLTIQNKDKVHNSYMPHFAGIPSPATMLAIIDRDPVGLFPDHDGMFLLEDMKMPFMHTMLYVLPFPTFSVTGLDGKFKIDGIPTGEAKIHAYSPQLDKSITKDIVIEEGKDLELDFTIEFTSDDLKKTALEPKPDDAAKE